MKDKEKLYYLLKEYSRGNYKTEVFTSLFSVQFNQETDYSQLSDIEEKAFEELSIVTGRYSPFEDDYKKCPNAFCTEEEVKTKVKEVINLLHNFKHH